ncbi:PAS domain-containing sensor histidine kinase [Streptomyces megasporus]|uniref:PAS domain-containing sensor histidine kinase n=1 Tax=Streptomyces megasporus TaxID=44060 RepID=UPI00068DCFA8|nr:PAS domain S-box protein [Streptomyces megasporus]
MPVRPRLPGPDPEPDPDASAALPPSAPVHLLVQGVLEYAIFMLDTEGRVVSWNAGAERIKGYRAEEIVGRHFSTFYPPKDVAAGKPDRELEIAVAEGRLEDEGWRVRADGSLFWANVVITALFDEEGVLRGFGKVTRDLTERRSAERALTEGRRLFVHLVEAQERERRRIAWDVHDDSVQAMVAVGMRLHLLAERLPEEYADELRGLDESVREAVARLRNLVFRMRPPEIDRNGLAEALSGHLAEMADAWGLRHSFHAALECEPSPETAVTVFRICQEALVNVHRHARAGTVDLSLASVGGGVLTRVTDDGAGVGAPPRTGDGRGHFGLLEMRERAEAAGGWWRMRNEPHGGTTVEFWLPARPFDTAPEPSRTGPEEHR